MKIFNYLNNNFYSKEELLRLSMVRENDFSDYQARGLMPQPSYRLNLNIECDSFFGPHSENQKIEYYAKGYSSWLGIIQSIESMSEVFSIFSERYQSAIKRLKDAGHHSASPKVNAEIDSHIEEEWGHFLEGIYGLCTKSGLPEDIAAKEFAILEITEMSEHDDLSEGALQKLTKAVNLLDSVSSMFAPHERSNSSRHRLVDEVRRGYKLQS